MTKDGFTRRVLESEQMLYRISMSMLRNTADCEDAVQQTIYTAYRRLSTLRNDEYFKTWITRILINECRDQLKRRGKTQPLELIEKSTDDGVQQSLELRQALNSLSPKLRTVLIMKYGEGFSVKEISRTLRIPEGTVKSRLAAAKDKLKAELGEQSPTGEFRRRQIMQVI